MDVGVQGRSGGQAYCQERREQFPGGRSKMWVCVPTGLSARIGGTKWTRQDPVGILYCWCLSDGATNRPADRPGLPTSQDANRVRDSLTAWPPTVA